ncbi:transcription factor HES-5-like [Stegostoma tigrinum]|uniref:transcription factor HES-5-like n=1 Tax=Stegostoma tigrinum TaxID=3053191 RepID=UPI00202B600B|nr:transcription factor HES-5-like [Stegostoma tigrinum]
MAPKTSGGIPKEHPEEKATRKEKYKLMKPIIEKKRRDRINSSIGQLKALLREEFQNQEPNMKMEKADILEMTVNYLRLHNQRMFTVTYSKTLAQNFKEGYSRCLQEIQHFSFSPEGKKGMQNKLVNHLHRAQEPAKGPCYPLPPMHLPVCQPAIKQELKPSVTTLWRPW